MALNIGRNFEPNLEAARFRIPAAAPPPLDHSGTAKYEGGEEINFAAKEKKKKKRVILDIDLNALPQDDYPAIQNGGNDQKRRLTAVVSAECGPGFNVISEEVVGGEKDERERRKRHWKALLEVGDDALREYEENMGKRGKKFQRGRPSHEDRRPSRGSELGSELAAAAPVTRSTRGRAVALPNKYRDSFVGAVVEAQFSHRRLGKSTAAHRKTR